MNFKQIFTILEWGELAYFADHSRSCRQTCEFFGGGLDISLAKKDIFILVLIWVMIRHSTNPGIFVMELFPLNDRDCRKYCSSSSITNDYIALVDACRVRVILL